MNLSNDLRKKIEEKGEEKKRLLEKENVRCMNCNYLLEPVIFLVYSAVMTNPAILAQFVLNHFKEIRLERMNSSHPINLTNFVSGHNISKKVTAILHDSKEAAFFIFYLEIFHSVPVLISISLFGPWSDAIGRKPIMYTGLIGLIIETSLLVLIVGFKLSIYFLFLSKFIGGICGGAKVLLLFNIIIS